MATVAALGLCACGLDKLNATAQNSTAQALSAVDDAIRSLGAQSDNWRSTLENLVKKLDPKSLLRNEVAALLQDSIGVANAGALCSADFIAKRAADALQQLKSGKKIPLDPTACEVVPAAVEFAHWQKGDSPKATVYGYDLQADDLAVWVFEGREKHKVGGALAHTTRYQLTVDLGKKGVPLGEKSTRIKVVRGDAFGDPVAEIAVIQPTTPVCETKPPEVVAVHGMTLVPEHVGTGDAEFDGNGPRVSASYRLSIRGDTIVGTLAMDAIEADSSKGHPARSDFTRVTGRKRDVVYRAPAGFTIQSLDAPAKLDSSIDYYDVTEDVDDHFDGGNGPVAHWAFRGDRDGDDVGYTNVTAKLNPLRVTLREDENCISPDRRRASR